MADWDSADLLARLKRTAAIPATTEYPTDAQAYQLLSEAQHYWMMEMATHVPESQYTAPRQLTSADGGVTYTFPNPWPGGSGTVEAYACEIYDRIDGRRLTPGAFWQPERDYVFEGNLIRFAGNKAKTFTNGPYARYVAHAPEITASVQPVLRPNAARLLVILRAAAYHAARGGLRDPQPYYDAEARYFFGDPNLGMAGLLAALKMGDLQGGMQAYGGSGEAWYHGMDLGGWIP